MCVCFNNPGKVIVIPVPHGFDNPGKVLLIGLPQHFLFRIILVLLSHFIFSDVEEQR